MLLAAHSRRASRSCRAACADRLSNAPASPVYLALHFLHVAHLGTQCRITAQPDRSHDGSRDLRPYRRFITSNPRDGSVYPLPAPAESVVAVPLSRVRRSAGHPWLPGPSPNPNWTFVTSDGPVFGTSIWECQPKTKWARKHQKGAAGGDITSWCLFELPSNHSCMSV